MVRSCEICSLIYSIILYLFENHCKLFFFSIHDRHTLWKRVQAVVVPLLAHLVSLIDRDQNMDLLLDTRCGESVKKLWLDIFGNEKLLEISHLTLDHT